MPEENVAQEAVEQPVEAAETAEPAQAEAIAEAPAEEPQQEVEQPVEHQQTDSIDYGLTQFMQPPVQAPSFEQDENGFIDPNQFYNKVLADAEARIEQKLAFQESERRVWQSVENKYPELKEDSELRDIVNAQRLADVARGGKGDLNAIAKQVLGKMQSYQARGKAQAQVSEKVQKSAALQNTTANNVDTNKDADLMERMSRGDSAAKEQLITEWLEAGKL